MPDIHKVSNKSLGTANTITNNPGDSQHHNRGSQKTKLKRLSNLGSC